MSALIRAGIRRRPDSVLGQFLGPKPNDGSGRITPLILPWPDRVLHPNARPHFMVLSKAKKAARAYAAWATKNAWPNIDLPATGRLHLWIDFYAPDKRRRDDDGLLSSMKAARDGIADALGIDDSRFVSHPWIKDQTFKGGKVEIRITPSPPEAQE